MSQDYKKLVDVLPKFLDEASKDPRLQFVDVNMKVNVDARLDDLKIKIDAENKINQDELGIDTSTLRLQY
jgi:hypothetical protein